MPWIRIQMRRATYYPVCPVLTFHHIFFVPLPRHSCIVHFARSVDLRLLLIVRLDLRARWVKEDSRPSRIILDIITDPVSQCIINWSARIDVRIFLTGQVSSSMLSLQMSPFRCERLASREHDTEHCGTVNFASLTKGKNIFAAAQVYSKKVREN